MTRSDPEHVATSSRRRLDRALGALNALVGLAAALLIAQGLNSLTGTHLTRAIVLLGLAVAVRAAVAIVTDDVVTAQQRRLRAAWHRRSATQLARSRPEEMHVLDRAVDQISEQPLLDVTAAAAGAALSGLVIVFVLAGWLSTVIVIALVALSVPVYVRVGRQSVALLDDFHRRRATLLGRQVRLLRSITDLRALGAVDHGAREIAAASDAESRAVIQGVRVTIRSALVTEFLGGVSVGLVAMVVGLRLWHHSIGLFHALGAVLVTAEMFSWWRRYGTEFHRRDDATTAKAQLDGWREAPVGEPTSELLRVNDVTTAAPCQSVSLVVDAGDRIGLRGPSGIGKSSLIETALGLREPLSGTVRRSDALVGLVRADNHFVDGTVRDNVALGADHPDDTIRRVLHELGLSGRFDDLDIDVGEDARNLSGGERVKLAIARALLAPVQLLVLDDVAGLLDDVSRTQIRDCLRLRTSLAVLEASHDSSLLDAVDHLVELRSR